MEILTTAATAILADEGKLLFLILATVLFISISYSEVALTPPRKVFGNITNNHNQIISQNPSIKALFHEKLSSTLSTKTPGYVLLMKYILFYRLIFLTIRKRKKSCVKYGDENEAPLPKTPKGCSTKEHLSNGSPLTPMSNLKMLTRIASMEEHLPNSKDAKTSFKSPKSKKSLRRCFSENETIITPPVEVNAKPKLRRVSTISEIPEIPFISPQVLLDNGSEHSRRDKSLGLLCER